MAEGGEGSSPAGDGGDGGRRWCSGDAPATGRRRRGAARRGEDEGVVGGLLERRRGTAGVATVAGEIGSCHGRRSVAEKEGVSGQGDAAE